MPETARAVHLRLHNGMGTMAYTLATDFRAVGAMLVANGPAATRRVHCTIPHAKDVRQPQHTSAELADLGASAPAQKFKRCN